MLLILAAGPVAAQPVFMGLGDLPGGSVDARATDLSSDGSTVVGIASSSTSFSEGFRWSLAIGMVGIGLNPGGTFSEPNGVSADGSVIAGRANGVLGHHSFRWTSAEGIVDLGDVPAVDEGNVNAAEGISGTGDLIVGRGGTGPAWFAYRWTVASGFTVLDSLGDTGQIVARDVSSDGSLLVGLATNPATTDIEPVYWNASGIVSLQPGGKGAAHAISGDGSTIVGYVAVANNTDLDAFRWTAAEGLVHFALNNGAEAIAVNGDGSVIIGRGGPQWSTARCRISTMWIWEKARGVRCLADVLVNDFGLSDVDGWRLGEPVGLSEDGRVIVGSGENPSGQDEPWIAILPPPSIPVTPSIAYWILVFSLAAVCFMARSRHWLARVVRQREQHARN